MGRVAKKAPEAAAKVVEDSPTQTVTQTRARRTPKPNPKYTNEAIVLPPKLESSDTEDTEEKPIEKVVKSVKKATETPASAKGIKAGRGRPGKKQKLEYDEAEEADEAKPSEDEKPAGPRATRSKVNDSLKVGDESVAIVDVSSIISKTPATKPESPKPTPKAGPGRKRAVPEEPPKEDQAKKKKEEEKPSLITARKSYMPSPALSKKVDVKEEELVEAPKTPPSTIKTRRNALVPTGDTPQAGEPAEKKAKVEEAAKSVETKRLPIVRKAEQITKMTPVIAKSPTALPTKIIGSSPKPIPRILNSMVTPKGKQSPNVKLAGDGTDKKVFSIDLTDDSIKEKKIIVSPVKSPPLKSPPVAVKENVAYNKPQPSMVLKNKLESELSRMKASANMIRRQMIPTHRHSLPTQVQHVQTSGAGGARRITKFESWYVIDVKNLEPTPFRHQHTQSLIKLGNSIKELQLPSESWDYKVTLQRRLPRKENINEEEVYEGDVTDKSMELEKHNYEPSSILFKRSHRESNKISIDRSLMLKANMYTITMNGKQCKLIGAPDDIKSMEDLEILLSIIDSSTLSHSCVELVTNHDIITIM